MFTLKGTYQRQLFVNRAGPSGGSVCGFAFSPDPEQEFLYVADYGNSRIVVVDRKKLEIVYQFGTRGTAPGQFQGVHMLATDSKGNLYVAEVAPGARLQKFTFKGMSTSPPPERSDQRRPRREARCSEIGATYRPAGGVSPAFKLDRRRLRGREEAQQCELGIRLPRPCPVIVPANENPGSSSAASGPTKVTPGTWMSSLTC